MSPTREIWILGAAAAVRSAVARDLAGRGLTAALAGRAALHRDSMSTMLYRIAADAVVAVHAAFVLFVVLGGLLAIRWRWMPWVHLPSVAWGALIEFTGWMCPLTPLEDWLRERGSTNAYAGDFIEHYLFRVLYPSMLTRRIQIALGVFALGINLVIYGQLLRRVAASRS